MIFYINFRMNSTALLLVQVVQYPIHWKKYMTWLKLFVKVPLLSHPQFYTGLLTKLFFFREMDLTKKMVFEVSIFVNSLFTFFRVTNPYSNLQCATLSTDATMLITGCENASLISWDLLPRQPPLHNGYTNSEVTLSKNYFWYNR